jgi:beta-lactamase superfamily II metal-dependent hydrolase
MSGEKESKRFISAYDLQDVDLINAPHHGGYYSNLKKLYEETDPDCVLIGVGSNGYSLPSRKHWICWIRWILHIFGRTRPVV